MRIFLDGAEPQIVDHDEPEDWLLHNGAYWEREGEHVIGRVGSTGPTGPFPSANRLPRYVLREYEALESAPNELPDQQITVRRGSYRCVIAPVGPDRWIVETSDDPDDRQGHLRRSGQVWTIEITGNPAWSGIQLESWRAAVEKFF